MQVSTQAIVLNYTKYSDSAIIVNLYTELLGRQAVIVYGISSKKTNKLSYFQPLYLLDVVLTFKNTRQINTLKEVKTNPVLPNLTSDFIKSTQALFLAEVLSKSLRQQERDENLFQYLSSSIQILDNLNNNYHNFHLVFLLKLSKHLGFWINNKNLKDGYYDFQTGQVLIEKPKHPFFISTNDLELCIVFQTLSYHELNKIRINNKERNRMLEAIIKMYEFHITNFNKMKSFNVLQEVFS